MANIFSDIAVSPSGSTLLNAMKVTTSAGTVLNEVVTLGDASNPNNVGSVLASGAQLVEPGGVNTQPISAATLPLAIGAGTIGYNQLVVTSATGGTQIVGARATRKALVVECLTTTAAIIFLGDSAVAQTSGLALAVGQAVSIPTTAAVYGIASGTTTSNTVSYMELYS